LVLTIRVSREPSIPSPEGIKRNPDFIKETKRGEPKRKKESRKNNNTEE